MAGNTFATMIDNLRYEYSGNRLTKVTDEQQNASGYPYLSAPNTIAYDANGNMTNHLDKGISSIQYNYLNLPKQVTQNGVVTENTYRADGVKVKKLFGDIETNYLDGFQYKALKPSQENPGGLVGPNDTAVMKLRIIPTSEGYFDVVNNQYIYNYTDHLGNVRLSYSDSDKDGIIQPRRYNNPSCTEGTGPFDPLVCIDNWKPGEIVEVNNYYPFGLMHNYTATTQNAYQYKYNGKELQETGMYDYGARMYMPDLGRWGVVDPLAESYRRWSPYHYAMNNPVKFTDPDGMGSYDENGTWHSEMEDYWNYHGYANGPTQNANISYNSLMNNGGADPDSGGGSVSGTVGELLDALLADCPNCAITEQNGREMVATARLLGYIFAANNMEYFLNGNGGTQKDKIISSKFLKGNSSVRHGTALNVTKIFNKKFNESLKNMKLGETITLRGVWTDSYYASANELDLLYGSGGYQIITNVSLKVTRGKVPGLNGFTFSGNIGVSYFDTYDWDPGKGDYVPGFGYTDDSDFSELKENGQASDFNMRSSWNIKISDWGYHSGSVRASLIDKIMQTR